MPILQRLQLIISLSGRWDISAIILGHALGTNTTFAAELEVENMGPEVFRCQGLNSWENKIVDTGHVDSEENPSEKRERLLVRSENVLKQPKN